MRTDDQCGRDARCVTEKGHRGGCLIPGSIGTVNGMDITTNTLCKICGDRTFDLETGRMCACGRKSAVAIAAERFHDDLHGPMCTCELSGWLRRFAASFSTEQSEDEPVTITAEELDHAASVAYKDAISRYGEMTDEFHIGFLRGQDWQATRGYAVEPTVQALNDEPAAAIGKAFDIAQAIHDAGGRIEITDEMVERALTAHGEAWYAACEGLPKRLALWADRNASPEIMRTALEAALNQPPCAGDCDEGYGPCERCKANG